MTARLHDDDGRPVDVEEADWRELHDHLVEGGSMFTRQELSQGVAMLNKTHRAHHPEEAR